MNEWIPILDNGFEKEIRSSISDIATQLLAMETSSLSSYRLSEHALLYAYLSLDKPAEHWHDHSLKCLNIAIERLSNAPAMHSGFHGGKAGFGWMVQHIISVLSDDEISGKGNTEDDPLLELDRYILRLLSDENSFSQNFDLISGYVGIGIYWLERLPCKNALLGVRATLDALETLSMKTSAGITWFTRPSLVPPTQRKSAPSGYYNLGVAHGVPGVIAFLAQATTLTMAKDIVRKASTLLAGSMDWLFAQQRPPDSISRYSSWIIPGHGCEDSRIAWCYGDLGIASVLQLVAERTQNETWEFEARSLISRCALRQLNSKVYDAPLCHGALGNAHIYNRAYQAHHDETYKQAAINWVHKGLDLRKFGAGIGGYYAWRRDSVPHEQADASFLSGAVGVALALLSIVAPIEPQWDRSMLLSGVNVASTKFERARTYRVRTEEGF